MRVWRVLLSYLGAVCKVKHADDHKAEYPLAAEVVNRTEQHRTVVTWMTSFLQRTRLKQEEMREQLNDFEDKARFHINKSEVIMDTPKAHRAIKEVLERRELPAVKI